VDQPTKPSRYAYVLTLIAEELTTDEVKRLFVQLRTRLQRERIVTHENPTLKEGQSNVDTVTEG
jgi:hypothetical protein